MATEPITVTAWAQPASRAIRKSAKRKATHRRRFLIVAVLLFAFSPLFAWCGARLLIVKAAMPAADAIVVLSGSSTYVERAGWAAQ
jgi:hypothetical protein